MRRLAHPTMAYGGAVAAGCIALVSAVEAWLRLQAPEGARASFPAFISDTLLAVALPLLAVAVAIGLSWLARRLGAMRTAAANNQPEAQLTPGSEPPASFGPLPGAPRRPAASASQQPSHTTGS